MDLQEETYAICGKYHILVEDLVKKLFPADNKRSTISSNKTIHRKSGRKAMNKAYKFRLYPNKAQVVLIRKTFGCVRFVYNKMFENRITIYEIYKDDQDALKQQKYTTPAGYKKEYLWLREVDSLALVRSATCDKLVTSYPLTGITSCHS